jgi:hypothetical protein
MAKKPRPTDEELMAMDHKDFVVWFIEYNSAIINKYVTKRLIPNRYSKEDVKSYMSERMLDILAKRAAKGKAIKNPRIYFAKLIDFWCIEYQRMHGYIYGMPKRPRNLEAEAEISKYGFVYLDTKQTSKNTQGFEESPQLAYVNEETTLEGNYEELGYQIKGEDPGLDSSAWTVLMNMIQPEDQAVMNCLYKMNMSIPEASRHLGIAVSTAYARKERALIAISGLVVTRKSSKQKSWKVINKLSGD